MHHAGPSAAKDTCILVQILHSRWVCRLHGGLIWSIRSLILIIIFILDLNHHCKSLAFHHIQPAPTDGPILATQGIRFVGPFAECLHCCHFKFHKLISQNYWYLTTYWSLDFPLVQATVIDILTCTSYRNPSVWRSTCVIVSMFQVLENWLCR